MVVISVSWKEFQKIDGGCRQDTTHKTHLRTYSLIIVRTAHSMRLAWLKFKTKRDLQASLCSKISVVIWSATCLIHGCSLTRLPPRALPLLHLPILPHNENTQCIPHISKLSQSKSCAIKNHSGVKTCRVAENRAQQLPTGYEPKEIATVSRIEAYSGDSYQSYDVQENFGEEDHRAPKKWRNFEKLGRLVCRI